MAIRVTDRRGEWATAYCTKCEMSIDEQWTFYAETIAEWKREIATAHHC